jgi:transposase
MSSPSNESKRERRHFSPQQKVAIVKQHLVDGKSVSDLCDEHKILPTQFYQWQKTLFEEGGAAFERKGKRPGKSAEQRKIEQLEEKLTTKNEVISELMEENVKAKKANGEL